MQTHDQSYHKKIMEYEHHLEQFIQEKYSLKINFITVMNWGYTTTAYYLKTDKGKYVCRISKADEQKRLGLIKDIQVSNILENDFCIPTYLASNKDVYLLDYVDILGQKLLLRVSDHVDGVNAFNISIENLGEMAQFLQKLHFGIDTKKQVKLKELFKTNEANFLHGDLTPTNCLVSYGKVVRVVDFEHSFFGPIEFDLARTAVFSWFHLNTLNFEEIIENIKKAYTYRFSEKAFVEYSKQHLNTHLLNIKKHEKAYEKKADFDNDNDFAQKMLLSFMAYLKAKGLS